jgi:transposase
MTIKMFSNSPSTSPTRDFNYEFSDIERTSQKTPFSIVAMANYLNRLDFINYINNRLSWDETQCKFSPGVLAQLLVLVPFILAQRRIALYAIPQAYANMNLELITGYKNDPITGQKIESCELNDEQFARLLDRIHAYGPSKLFHDLAITVRTTFSLPINYELHSDTTSHVLYGNYTQNGAKECEIPTITIARGYSKDKQPNLLQIQTGMITDGDGLPVFAYPLDGNNSDTSWNNMIIAVVHEVFGPEFSKHIYIADSKLMTKKNFLALVDVESSIPFISRLPESFCEKLSERMKRLAYRKDKWEYLGTCCNYPSKNAAVYYASTIETCVYGFNVHVHVYKTTEKREKVERDVAVETEQLEKKITDLSKNEFFCEKDAIVAMNEFLTSNFRLMVEAELEVVAEVTHKKPPGRPPKNPKPLEEKVRWRIMKQGIKRKEDKITDKIEKLSTFCLITNIVPSEKSSQEILVAYKGQSNVEGQFSILKQSFMAATIFLEKVGRIQALMVIIYFAALLHGILRVIARTEIEKEENPPRWGHERRSVVRPTSRTMLGILERFTVIQRGGVTIIDATTLEMEKEFERVLRVIRFESGFV